MKLVARTILCVSGGVILLAFGGLTIFGPIPELIGLPVLLVASILYGLEFEKAFSTVFVIAIVLMLFWLGVRLYPNYATQPKAVILYLFGTAAAIALAIKAAVSVDEEGKSWLGLDGEGKSWSGEVGRHRREKRARKELEAGAQRLVEDSHIEPREGEPSPPWIQFLGYPFFDGRDRFGGGPGDDYIQRVWGSFWSGLTINQRHEYFRHYDLGDQWPERDDWYSYWVTWEKMEYPSTYLKRLVAETRLQSKPGEPAPPWIKYPELDDATSDWSSGEGGDYLRETFLPFFNALTRDQKMDFLHQHDLGMGWDDRDEWMCLVGWQENDTR